MEWIGDYSPCFAVPSNNIQIMHNPNEFYSRIKKLIWTSHKRIILAAMYIEAGPLEIELVSSLRTALETSDAQFRVRVLLDCLRGTRGGEKSSAGILQDLVNEYTDNEKFETYLYHTPDLRGCLKRFLPERFNESIGVQHMKLYIFDDSVLVSGANLSESYFTNRQDRYMLFKGCPMLADFYAEIIDAVARSSLILSKGGRINLHPQCGVHPYLGDYDAYRNMFRSRVMDVFKRYKEKLPHSDPDAETVVYPVVQMAPFGINIEDSVLRKILACNFKEEPTSSMCIATGYFNLTTEYSTLIVSRGSYNLSVVSASPLANDFFGAEGLTGDVPALYVYALRAFYKLIDKFGRSHNIRLYEWSREGWTFHAKGLWWDSGADTSPSFSATIIGSSNYGYRSAQRDLEAQAVVITKNDKLREHLELERLNVFHYVVDVTRATFKRTDHSIACWIRFVYRWCRSFF